MYLSLNRNSILKCNYAGTIGVSCDMLNDVISIILRNSDTDSENVSLIQRSVSDGQKTCTPKGVSLIGI